MSTAENITIKKAAVLGAGVMGAQIAAHLTNAGVETILYDLASDKGEPNALVAHSIKALKNLKPSPLGMAGIENKIIPANYNFDLEKLKDCDLIIEAIAERIDWKENLYHKIGPFLKENSILATNTSGLSIKQLANACTPQLKKRFCGIHFFNPPRYMKLVEIIPHEDVDKVLLQQLETFLVTRLGKGVVYAKDTPNFIGNRIGVFTFLAAAHHSRDLGLMPDVVDALTGTLIGRPKSATFRTMDIVGLDTMAHVVDTLKRVLKDDPWKEYFTLPDWIEKLIERGALGQKNQVGIYKKIGNEIQVYDFHDECYRKANNSIDPNILAILKEKNAEVKFEKLQHSSHPQAQFLWRIFRDLFHYCAYYVAEIANTTRDIDLAMRWGYGWKQGPFETWQSANWQKISQFITQEANEGKAMSPAPLPKWALDTAFMGPYQNAKAYAPATNQYEGFSELGIYRRQFFGDAIQGQKLPEGETHFETPHVRMWTMNDKIAILNFKTKRNCISVEVLEGVQEAIAKAEKDFDALVLWQMPDADFSIGADLSQIVGAISNHRWEIIEKAVRAFQETALALRYAKVPTVAAIKGLTLGGGCELSMHTTSIVAAFETYMGLVEVGVGLLPAGAGSKELARRAYEQSNHTDLFKQIKIYFDQIAMGQVSISAMDARRLGYLQSTDSIVMNTDELLYMAKRKAAYLADITYYPPIPPKFAVAGKPGIANLMTVLVNMREGGFISEHEYLMGTKIAHVICGGEVEAGAMVDEDWMLQLEREAIIELTKTKETLERIKYMLENGKPLRN